MNFLKGYVGAISDFVSGVVGGPDHDGIEKEQQLTELNSETKVDEQPDEENMTESVPQEKDGTLSGLLNWVPKLQKPIGENAVVYYMNRLASFGGENPTDVNEQDSTGETPTSVITSDVSVIDTKPLSDPLDKAGDSSTPANAVGSSHMEGALLDWLDGLSARTGEVWNQIKQDFGEVVSVVSKEPRDTMTRTASSVRQHISALADAALKINPNEFALLPESTAPSGELEKCSAPEETIAAPPALSDLPSLSSLRLEVSHLLNGFMTSLFGSDDVEQPAATRDRREARLQIIRADPATYECEPSPPPPHSGVHSYADWRAAYFDEVTCQPRPGVPLSDIRDPINDDRSPDSLLEPPHPGPEELLDQYPFMRTYLTQLVHVEGQPGGKGLTDADFWSRYYYRVWLLDVTERRRQKLAERITSTTTLKGPDSVDAKNRSAPASNEVDKPVDNEENDWFADSDPGSHSELQAMGDTGEQVPAVSAPVATEAQDSPNGQVNTALKSASPHPDMCAKTNRLSGKSRKKRVKKRSGLIVHEADRDLSGSESPTPPTTSRPSTVGLQNTGIGQKQPDQSAVESVSHLELGTANRPVGESDEIFTSGSSSVVVLSNSEDESEVPSSHPPKSSPRKTNARNASASNIVDENLVDWGDTTDDERSQSSTGNTAAKASSATGTHTEIPPSYEMDDWESWN